MTNTILKISPQWRGPCVAVLILLGTSCGRAPQRSTQESPASSVAPAEELKEGSSKASPQAIPSISLRDLANDNNDKVHQSDGEPSIAVNPTNPREIAVVAFSGSWRANPPVAAFVWESFDGGKNWEKLELLPAPPVYKTATEPPRSIVLDGPADQRVTFDGRGHLVVVEMASDPADRNYGVNLIYHQSSGPKSALVPGPFFGDGVADQPQVAADPEQSTCTDRIYSAWLRIDSHSSIDSVSLHTGPSITKPVVAEKEPPNRSTRIAVGKGGKAYLLYKTRPMGDGEGFEPVNFRVRRSDDCGLTWNSLGAPLGIAVHGTDKVFSLFTSDFGNLAKTSVSARARAKSSDAWIAANPATDEVNVTYVNRNASGLAQVFLARSTDAGKTWTSTRVSDGNRHSAYPEVAVTRRGAISVMYIDFSEAGNKTMFHHNLAISFDQGKTWTRQTLQSLDPSLLTNADNAPDLWGDYEGLTAQGDTIYGVFCGKSIGRKALELDPIFFSVDLSGVSQ